MPEVIDVVLGKDAAVPGVQSRPDGAAKGAVVVVQEAFGLTPHIRNVCARLADAGFVAVAPALFHRQGAPVLGYDEIDRARPIMGQLRADDIVGDVRAALDTLEGEGLGAPGCGIVGFCMGGTVALAVGATMALGAAVTFYGGGVTEGRFGFAPLADLAPSLQTPWLGCFGDQDASIPVAEVERLREAAATAAVPTEVVRYPAAGHGFNCDDRSAYEPAAAADAWGRTLDWFGVHLAP